MSFKVKDHYFKQAKKQNFLARSIFKLEEIDKKYRVFQKGERVLDLGYHPGSWIQYTSKAVGKNGSVYGLDIRPINKKLSHLKNVFIEEKDIFDINSITDVGGTLFDVVVSDMAPNTTGIKSVDQDRSLNLVEKVFELLPKILKKDGNFVIKVFDSNSAQHYLKTQKDKFNEFHYLKPKSTRSVSKEFFVIGKGFNDILE